MLSRKLCCFRMSIAILSLAWNVIPIDAAEPIANAWLVDVRSGKIVDAELREVLRSFREAAEKPPVSRKTELEKCDTRLIKQFPTAPEIDLIYALELMRVNQGGVAKSHLDKRAKDLAEYWPARRLSVYLHSSSESVPATANRLEAFAVALAAREQQPQVLSFNAEWVGKGLEGLRISAPDNAAVEKAVQACELALQSHAEHIEKGREGAIRLAAALGTARQRTAEVIEKKAENKQQEIDAAKQSLDNQQEQVSKARETLNAARPAFEQAAATHWNAMLSLQPHLVIGQRQVDDAKSQLDRAKEKEKENRDGVLKAQEHLRNCQSHLDRLQREFSTSQISYSQIVTVFQQKYAGELKIDQSFRWESQLADVKTKKNVKGIQSLDSRKKAVAALHPADFLRPDVERLLADIAQSLEHE